ncbi:hypothetical protein N0B16_00110 [Chryseobacterium sp. GMJ5]|uniref:Uncharacterized protein n=1 Tax=Chryseobacterium gilvum TaxID=2976534 RepID=A0ABT2VS62_9FLAO|nr:hypothetical protein [Chryseobacterium gilvum]MCU7612834.1 hypothetical protein [Chryseobacterium gilvum]
MDKEKLKSFLELEIIWKDDDMFELKVTVSNGRYYGITEVYDTTESLLNFAQTLINFPNHHQTTFYETGYKDGYAYFSMRFYCIDKIGHIGLEINLEDKVATEFREEQKNKLKLEIIVEPSAIDNFQRALDKLAINQKGFAILYGRDNRLISNF